VWAGQGRRVPPGQLSDDLGTDRGVCNSSIFPEQQRLADNDTDEEVLASYVEAIRRAQGVDRRSVRESAADGFGTDRLVNAVVAALDDARRFRPSAL
jgi:hypothetical protein